jgi:hypothetical protein
MSTQILAKDLAPLIKPPFVFVGYGQYFSDEFTVTASIFCGLDPYDESSLGMYYDQNENDQRIHIGEGAKVSTGSSIFKRLADMKAHYFSGKPNLPKDMIMVFFHKSGPPVSVEADTIKKLAQYFGQIHQLMQSA